VTYEVPLSSDDLRVVADAIESLEKALIKGGSYIEPFGETLIGDVRIEIKQPDGYAVIGYAVLDDGWIGFQPKDSL
jgi:hypothetical protein